MHVAENRNPEKRMKKVAIFGAGKMAMHHIQAINLLTEARVVAVADPVADRKKLQHILAKDILIFANPEDLLRSIHPDVVHICTPPDTHTTLATMALKHEAHVYVEKPFALKSYEADEVISLAIKNELKVCAGHQLLYEPQMLKVFEQIKMLGKIVHIESYFSFKPVRRSNNGQASISPIDQLIDILPHPVYLLLYFLKLNINNLDVVPVEIRGLDVRTDGNINGIFRCGDTTGILVVTLTGRPIESYIRVVGTNGSLFAEFVRGTSVAHPGPGTSGISKIINPYSQAWQTAMGSSIALFKRAMKKQKSYPGLYEIFNAFYKSLEPGREDVLKSSSIIETVSICEKIGNQLKIMEEDENKLAEASLANVELKMTKPEAGRGGVLVTGGTGMLGSAVAKELRNNNWIVRVISRKWLPFSERIPGVNYVNADLAESISSEILQDTAVVVHCAAETIGGKEAHERNTINATRNLLHIMELTSVKKFVYISSIAVLISSRENRGLIDENTSLEKETESRGPYVWGKAEAEKFTAEFCSSHGIEYRIIRPGPLVDYNAFSAPGRLGREVGPLFVAIGSKNDKLSICNVLTAAEVIRNYVECFDAMPPILNLIETNSPTRGELVSHLLNIRPDLKAIRIPSSPFWLISTVLKILQRVLRPRKKPLDIYAAFASEKYNSDLAAKIIEKSKK